MNNINTRMIKSIVIGIFSATGFYFLLGFPTATVQNPWFTRMIPTTMLDTVFLIMNALLLGVYIGIYFWKKSNNTFCNITSTSGGIMGVLAFGCPICNKLLVLLFGTTALMNYLEPIRPVLGSISILMILIAIYLLIKNSSVQKR